MPAIPPRYNDTSNNQSILLFLDEEYTLSSNLTLKNLLLPIILIVMYVIFLIWSILKDREEKSFNPGVDIKSTSAIGAQAGAKLYNKWDPNYTQDNWTNITAMNVTSINTVTDREEENPSISFIMNKSSLSTGTVPTTRPGNRPLVSRNSLKAGEVELPDRQRKNQSRKRSRSPMNISMDVSIENHGQSAPSQHTEYMDTSQVPESRIMKSKTRGRTPSVRKAHKKESFSTKFVKLAFERNPILSLYFKSSKIFPRFKRLTLIFALFQLNLFMTSLIFLLPKSQHQLRAETYLLYVLLDWVIFIVLVALIRVSKQKLKSSSGFEEFLTRLKEIRQEVIVKNVVLMIIYIPFTLICFTQLIIFAGEYSHLYLQCVIAGIVMSFIHLGLIDLAWCAVLAVMYARGYESGTFRSIYRFINRAVWKI